MSDRKLLRRIIDNLIITGVTVFFLATTGITVRKAYEEIQTVDTRIKAGAKVFTEEIESQKKITAEMTKTLKEQVLINDQLLDRIEQLENRGSMPISNKMGRPKNVVSKAVENYSVEQMQAPSVQQKLEDYQKK